MRYLPIGLDVRGRSALVIGTGAEARSKIDRLLEAGARVTVIEPAEPPPDLERRAQEGAFELCRRRASLEDMSGKAVTFVSPGDDELSRGLYERALREGRLVCTLDRPEVSTFINVAVARAPGVTLSIGTDGASPSLSRRIREDLEALFADPRFARFVDTLRALRSSLPRGERAARAGAAVQGFAIEACLRFPAWFERGAQKHGDDPSSDDGST